jgi:hypothetical protein
MRRIVAMTLIWSTLLAGCVGFTLAILWQVTGDPVGSVAIAPAISPGKPVDITDRSASWVAEAMARPLFSPTRRPPPRPTASTQTAATANGGARLTGIVISPAGRQAIFAPVDGGKSIVLSEGGHLGDETIEAIRPDAITLAGPAGRRFLGTVFEQAARGRPGAAQTDFPPPPVLFDGLKRKTP